MSRIYIVTNKENDVDQYVRANTLNGAMRAVANQTYIARTATTDEMFLAFKAGLVVLDAVKDEETPNE
jgi:hypothetical protein